MEQMSSSISVLDLDLSDLEDVDSIIIARSPSLSNRLGTQGRKESRASSRNDTPAPPPPPPQPPPSQPETPVTPPRKKKNPLQMFSTTRYDRTKELLSDAGLGVNRVVAVAPTIPQNQYWMLPGAICDD